MFGNDNSGQFVFQLTIAFVVLKLCGVIDWGWGWVVSPIWITIVLAFLVAIILAIKKDSDEKKSGK